MDTIEFSDLSNMNFEDVGFFDDGFWFFIPPRLIWEYFFEEEDGEED